MEQPSSYKVMVHGLGTFDYAVAACYDVLLYAASRHS